jgi:hypothetical protein
MKLNNKYTFSWASLGGDSTTLYLVMSASYLFKNSSSSLGFQFLIQLTIVWFLSPLAKRNHIMNVKIGNHISD